MNNFTASFDSREFRQVLGDLAITGKRTVTEEVNQRAMNVAVRAFKLIPPHDVGAKRREVKAYMDTQLSQRVQQNKTGKNKGKFRKMGARKNQLMRKHLIIQARRAKQGLKGLYGNSMRKASGELSRAAQISQGYLKSVFIPIIVGLYPVVKFRPPASLTNSVSRWPGSSGHGKATPAKEGDKPVALLETVTKVISGQEPKARLIQVIAFTQALRDETSEMKSHLAERLARHFRKASARK